MKTLLISAFILIITSVSVSAQYIEGQENKTQEDTRKTRNPHKIKKIDGKSMTTKEE